MIDFNCLVDKIKSDTISDELSIYLQEIMLVLNSEPHEVLGCPDMSINLEYWMYDIQIESSKLQSLILEKIRDYCSMYQYFPTTVSASFSKGTLRDICLIDIVIQNTSFKILVS